MQKRGVFFLKKGGEGTVKAEEKRKGATFQNQVSAEPSLMERKEHIVPKELGL